MSHEPIESPPSVEEQDAPEMVPEADLRGIEALHDGRTATTEELIEASLSH